MKAIIFPHDEASALELAAAAASQGADEIVEVRVGNWDGSSAASAIAVLDLPDEVAAEDAFESVLAWFQGQAPDIVMASPTRTNKTLVGRLAANAKASAIANIVTIEDGVSSTRYFGGVANRNEKPTSDTAFYFIADGSYDPAPAQSAATDVIAWVEPKASCKIVERKPIEKDSVDLNKSDIVVSCGRGFSEKDDLQMAYDLAGKIDAGVGCTRPLTEAVDWFPHESYIGVSGQIVKPRVFIAAGLSGQMQHMVGANNSECIIAINKDKDAPIFKQCDIGIVGDIKQVLPALSAAL